MLKRTKDRKVTNLVTKGGNPSIANSFGLPAGKAYSCPGATKFCESICYAGKLEKIYKGVKTVLLHNWELLYGAGYSDTVALLDSMITEFESECDRKDAPKLFRIHWDGDFFSDQYTKAWAETIQNHPNTRFWVYTRVYTAAAMLQGLDNLSLYFSADKDNLTTARAAQDIGIKIAYVGRTFAEGKEVFVRSTKCPENNKALPLISERGSACVACGLCIDERKNVLFSTSKR